VCGGESGAGNNGVDGAVSVSFLSIWISSPGQNASYTLGEIVDAQYSCSDPNGKTDLTSCTGPVPSGSAIPTKSVGVHTFTVMASDKEGDHISLTRSYGVYAANGSGQMTVSPSSVSASSAHHTVTFKYAAATGGIWHATLTLAVPAGWSAPSTAKTAPGYVAVSEGKVSVSARTITVQVPILASEHELTITYGSRTGGGPGATAPAATGTQTWPAEEKSAPNGTLTNLIHPPQIKVT
jgi:hypothetical protein